MQLLLETKPLFFLVGSAHAGLWVTLGSSETEVLHNPGVPGAISLASSSKDGAYPISWGSASGDFDRYELKERKDGGSWRRIYNGSARSKSVSGRSTGVYKYRVRACNDSAHSSRVNCGSFTAYKAITVVRKPGFISVPELSKNGSISVSWGSVSGAAGYKLQEKKNSGSWVKVYSGSSTRKTVSGRGNGLYKYRVAAVENGVTGSYRYSGEVTVSLTPAVPSGLSAPSSTSDGAYSVSWDSVPEAESYILEQSGTANGTWSQSHTGKNFSKALNGVYSYRVRACSIYNSVKSCSAYTAKEDVQVVFPKLSVQSVSKEGAVTLLFNIGWPEAEYCELSRSGKVIHDLIVVDGSTYTDTPDSSSNYKYEYTCQRCLDGSLPDNCFEPEPVGAATASAEVVLKPDTPNLSTDTANSTDGAASFSSVSSGPIGYVRWQKRFGDNSWPSDDSYVQVSSSNGSFQVAGLEDGSWEFRAKNCNSSGCSSSWSNAVSVQVLKKPRGDSSFTISGDLNEGLYQVKWTADSGTVDSYYLRESEDGAWGDWLDLDASRSYEPGRKPDGSYQYEMYACNTSGCSETVTSSLVTIDHPVPAVPSSLAASRNGEVIDLSWDKVTTGYDDQYQFRMNGEAWQVADTDGSAQQPVGSYGTYTFEVQSCNLIPEGRKCSDSATVVYEIEDPDPSVPGWAKPLGGLSILDAGYTEPQVVQHEQSVGTVGGSGSVKGGAASYQIPIDLPPGRNGRKPQISLGYSSRTGNSVLGVGWSINVGSVISRCPQTLAQDNGRNVAVSYSAAEDRLCLDGQRLIPVSGYYGESGTVYHTERERFIRVTQNGALNSSSTWFKIELKNGVVRYYGYNANSRQSDEGRSETLTWAITREEDSPGNSIVYQYDYFGSGEYQIADIYYTGSGTALGDRHVSFVYENNARPDIYSRYLMGGLNRLTRRLDKITTYSHSIPVTEYRFEYQESEASGRSLLETVEECGYKNSTWSCLEKSSFTWQDAKPVFTLEKFGYLSGGSEDNYLESSHLTLSPQLQGMRWLNDIHYRGDADGNGVQDAIGWNMNAEGEFEGANDVSRGDNCERLGLGWNCLYPDFNKDGKTDMWRSGSNNVLQISYDRGSEWIDTDIAIESELYSVDRPEYIGDCNGDGWPDLMWRDGVVELDPGHEKLYLWIHSGNPENPFQGEGKLVYTYGRAGNESPFYNTTYQQFIGDIDGNGLPDMVESDLELDDPGRSYSASPQPIPRNFYLAKLDRNGDLYFDIESVEKYALGLGFDNTGAIPEYFFQYFMDVNGDGLVDWLSWRSGNPGLWLSINKGGSGFTSWQYLGDETSLESRFFFWDSNPAYPEEYGFVKVPKYEAAFRKFDINADGRMEFLVPDERLVEACVSLFDSTIRKNFCGEDVYTWTRSTEGDNSGMPTPIDTSRTDDNVYKYKALRFTENANGVFTAEWVETPLIGSGSESVNYDAFGNGLTDFVFAFGPRFGSGTIQSQTGEMEGKSEGVYINRNRGSATGDERYEPTDMLIAVENGLGVRDEWHYRPLSSRDDRYHSEDKPFYERGGYLDSLSGSVQDDHFEFTSSMYVVAEHRQSNGVDGLNRKQYRYKGAVFNDKGRGFQGFHTIIEEDLAANIEIQSDFHQVFPLAGKLHKQRKWELGDRSSDIIQVDAFEESSYEWQFWPKGGHSSPVVVDSLTDNWSVAANDPYFVGPREQRTVHRTLRKSGSTRTELYTKSRASSFDQWGNVRVATRGYEETGGAHAVSSTTETQYVAADEANWWINKPLKQTVTKHVIQNRSGVSIDADTDVEQSVVIDYLRWDSNARKPRRVKTTPSNGKWTEVDTIYNDDGLPERVTSTAEGETESRIVKTTAFSSDGYFPKTVENSLGHTTTTITNPRFGKPDSVTDANGHTTEYEYDAFGRQITETAPSALGLKAAPDAHAALQWCYPSCSSAPNAVYKTIKQQAGTPTQISYHDSLGRVIRTEVQAFDGTDWVVTEQQFNALGQVTFESVPHNASSPNSYGTHYDGYDTLGRALGKTVDQTNGQVLDIDYTHEQGGGFTTNIVANGRAMSRTYNGLEQLIQTVDALGGTTKYAYDGAGNPIVLQDAAGNRITAKYNALGQKEWVNDPNMGEKSFTYTGFGEVETETDGNLDITSYTYDRLGRMETRSVNGQEEASWIYDSAANGIGLPHTEQKSDGGFTRTYRYDALSRPDRVTTNIDGEDFLTTSHYDSNYGRLKGLTYPSGLTLQYGYNDTGYRFRTSNAASGYTYRAITQMDAWGEWEFANVAAGNYTVGRDFYAETGQMAGTAFDSLVQSHQTLAYTYDNFGNLNEKTVSVPSQSPALNMESYVYDDLNRLDYSTRTDGPAIDYDYDAIGNLLKKDDFATSYDYDTGTSGGPSAVKSVTLVDGGTRTYGYDDNGNRTHEDGTQQIWYNAFNKPTHISRNGTDLYFSYGAGQQRYKQVDQANNKTTIYVDKLFERITEGGTTQYRHFIEDIAVVTTAETSSDTTHKIGFTHRDRLGSTVAIGDQNGNLQETHSFDPFGKPRLGNITDKLPSILDSQYTTRGFTDHEHLDSVELIHMNGRAYDYNLGRFLSVDPIIQSPGNSQSLNPYSYIMNNPLAGTDPSGYTCKGESVCESEYGKDFDSAWEASESSVKVDSNTKYIIDSNGDVYVADGDEAVKVESVTINGKNGFSATSDFGSGLNVDALNIGGMESRGNEQGVSGLAYNFSLAIGGATREWGESVTGTAESAAADPVAYALHVTQVAADTVFYYADVLMLNRLGLGTGADIRTANRLNGVLESAGASFDQMLVAAEQGDYAATGGNMMAVVMAVMPRGPKGLSGKSPPINRARQRLHTGGTPGKSQFKEGVDVENVVKDAWRNGTPRFNKNGKLIGKVKQYNDQVGAEGQTSVDVRFSRKHGIHGFPSNKTE
ncbi:SpvB/TcaC N-terminal domain-containing protein [Microbulbifer halophilus]|uniref:SpvB/TcaC N-terminal domain-containing protein n=1 Tax=Microbulbifer halophilus TaxID=453963 RepID=UPI00224342F8|nr:SpvB/TcaC N-terminal domain-containing protein [Microbulbifer halophilus]MCW8127427.1 hypothetical protein [Microbulbifer halophilus]